MAQVGDLTVNIHANVDADAVEASTLDALADRLVDRVFARLRERLPGEVRAMAEGAAAAPGLDELSLFALADWLEERQMAELSERVRRLAVKDGDLFFLQLSEATSSAAMLQIRRSVQMLQEQLKAKGKDVFFVVLPHGVTLSGIAKRGSS
jgi:hypothetical protein